MPEEKRRMAFYELGKGKLFQLMQGEFEQAQIIAMERNVGVKVCLEIMVAPPDINDPRFGQVKFKVQSKLPAKESAIYTTELESGLVISDGDDLADVLQEKLRFPEISGERIAENG